MPASPMCELNVHAAGRGAEPASVSLLGQQRHASPKVSATRFERVCRRRSSPGAATIELQRRNLAHLMAWLASEPCRPSVSAAMAKDSIGMVVWLGYQPS